ncbi:TPA: BppU family phage baseplate upper protein [Enterococcus faecium]
MASSLYNLALDFSKELNYTKAIMARQGDKGITVTVKPFLNGLQMDTSGGTFTLKGTTPSNRYVDSVATSITSEEVTFSLDGTFMSEAGYYKHCYVEYRKDNQILTTQDIIFFSLGVSDISQGQADEYVSQLEELIRKYNETFDTFMAEIKGRVDSLNKQITDLTGQAKTLQDKLDALKEEISKLGNLQVTYSNSIDFGGYDYSGNPNLMPYITDPWVGSLLANGDTVKDSVKRVITHTKTRTADTGDVLSLGLGIPRTAEANNRYLITALRPSTPYALTVTMSVGSDWTGETNTIGARVRYLNESGGTELPINVLLPANVERDKMITHTFTGTTKANLTGMKNCYVQIFSVNSEDKGTVSVSYDVKLEIGTIATPYQPNLLNAPYYLSKVALGENLIKPESQQPVTNSNYLIKIYNTKPMVKGKKYTITLEGTKPATQVFRPFFTQATGSPWGFGDLKPVEGLTDIWSATFTASTDSHPTSPQVQIYQVPNTSVGQCTIKWLKLEEGDTRTPNIEQYKYRGIGMRDSNNPKDYVWDLAPEYVEAEVTKKVAQVNSQLKEHVNDTNNPHEVTKNQVGLGNVDNFSTATQTEAEKGEASNKFMTPQRTTQMITKRIATDAEVVAGTDLNKLVTPKSLDIYYRDRTQVAVASYGTEDIALTAKEELSEASWRYRRIGDIVEFYGRFKLKEATDIVNVHELPTGFRLSTDFDDTSWNVPLNIQKAANPTSYVAGAFVERQGTNLLRVGGNSSGNHYVSGWWYTDDPFPTG